MAKESCSNCYTRLNGLPPFCPTCERPTRHASDAQRLEWDLSQWRAHVDRSVAAGIIPAARSSAGASLSAALATVPDVSTPSAPPDLRVAVAETPEPRIPKVRAPRLRRRERAAARPEQKERVVDLDADHAFAYRACATCDATDWIVRTTRNDDETWNYWCVRCSRSFKTEVKLRYAWRPFVSAGVVVGGLLAASMLMLR